LKSVFFVRATPTASTQLIWLRGDKNDGASRSEGVIVTTILVLELAGLVLTTAARAMRIVWD
jgi:hypothetical protein